MKRLLLIIACLLAFPAAASHIVGGEFEFLLKERDANFMRYSLNLILYFDLKDGDPNARDAFAEVRIFRKRDNAIMFNSIYLEYSEETAVEYFQPECSNGSQIITSKIYYRYRDPFTGSNLLSFSIDQFDDPEGYYITWERCCRNYTLTNIFSENPAVDPRGAGQTFYLEFPPMKVNGQPFYNSSPKLFPPLADYACPNRVYYVDFSGEDDDGDSLVYSLATPLSTHYISPLPPGDLPLPAPYPEVNYKPNFSATNVMRGSPDLHISNEGVLTVTPTVAGLFSFAVKIEEFRDKKKIGEVRRDFQMKVLTSCPTSKKPVIEAKYSQDPDDAFSSAVVVSDNNLCFDVRISDPDAATRKEVVTLSAFVVGARRTNVIGKINSPTTQVLENGQSATFSMCFPDCPIKNEQHTIGIIVSDKSCPLPLRDTIYVKVDMVQGVNSDPEFDKEEVVDVVTEGTEIPAWKQPFVGTDDDGDDLEIRLSSDTGFDPGVYGFTLNVTQDNPGLISAQLAWDTRCDVIDFSKKTQFSFAYVLDDLDKCNVTPNDTIRFDLTRDFKDFHYPVIQYAEDPDSEHVFLNQQIYEPMSFVVRASDIDNDVLDLSGKGVDFDMTAVGASFPKKTFTGYGEQTFAWEPDCKLLENIVTKPAYDFEMIVVDDNNICHYILADTLTVTVTLLPPNNLAPEISIDDSSVRMQKTVVAGETITFPVRGDDNDIDPKDMLTLSLVSAEGTIVPQDYTFSSTPAPAHVDGTFSWTPSCDVFTNGNFTSDFVFNFKVNDDRCYSEKEAMLEVDVHVIDRDPNYESFDPRPNVITSNGDGMNDFFGMYRLDEDGTTLVSILPKDNCEGKFVDVSIFNRWGRKVYSSSDREFKWFPESEATGIYYYYIHYSNKEYKGVISVLAEGSK
jgi:hypothetical protein